MSKSVSKSVNKYKVFPSYIHVKYKNEDISITDLGPDHIPFKSHL